MGKSGRGDVLFVVGSVGLLYLSRGVESDTLLTIAVRAIVLPVPTYCHFQGILSILEGIEAFCSSQSVSVSLLFQLRTRSPL